MSFKKVMDSATESRIYKQARRRVISQLTGKCSICKPHAVENESRSRRSKNWKKLRKKQWV